jgi:uncharacterized protein YbjT (DUF2867 family)
MMTRDQVEAGVSTAGGAPRPSISDECGGGIVVTGPISITGASGQVGSALQRRLSALPNEVRPLGRGDDLAAAFRDATAVVHLAGTLRPQRPNTYVEANLRTVERTVAALAGSSVERIIFLSYVGASEASPNAYLRTKAEAEDVLRHAGRDAVIFRCTHIVGPPGEPGPTVTAMTSQHGRPVWVLGSGKQRVAPVYREDVVDAIVAALDGTACHGRFDLAGPEEMTMDDLVRVVNGGPVRLRHLPPFVARTLAHADPSLTPELVDILLADSLGDQVRAVRAFGLERRRLGDIYLPRESVVPRARIGERPDVAADRTTHDRNAPTRTRRRAR